MAKVSRQYVFEVLNKTLLIQMFGRTNAVRGALSLKTPDVKLLLLRHYAVVIFCRWKHRD
jgi:hypothetical protein